MMLKTFASSFALLTLVSLCPLRAQQADTTRTVSRSGAARPAAPAADQTRGIQYTSREEAAAALEAQKRLPLFAGASVSTDLCGLGMALAGKYGQYEAAARLNLRGRYFPIAEVGIGSSNHTDETTALHYKVNAPYVRLGMDYNVAKNPRGAGRIFVGARYGWTSFKYAVDGPDLTDPVYGTVTPYRFTGLRGTNHWGELVFGLEAKVWSILHLGWSFRYRIRFYDRQSAVGSPWYVPGFGKNDTHNVGGTFNLIFDI